MGSIPIKSVALYSKLVGLKGNFKMYLQIKANTANVGISFSIRVIKFLLNLDKIKAIAAVPRQRI